MTAKELTILDEYIRVVVMQMTTAALTAGNSEALVKLEMRREKLREELLDCGSAQR